MSCPFSFPHRQAPSRFLPVALAGATINQTQPMRNSLLMLPALALLAGCGYHQAGTAAHLPPSVRTLAVPAFSTRVQSFGTEILFTEAVIRELNTRTRYRVENTLTPSADTLLSGSVLSEVAAPLTYDSLSGQTSSYLLTITAKVVLTDQHTNRILYENDALTYREQYQSTTDLNTFIQEDPAAARRIARNFAQAVVSEILESF